ncbi:MAG TPA: peroxiredoxin-like family protein [Candidatus Angelobacter sp.]|nr:peroxiredoxin-like family protein [Candidatus Angelobacter sp.]
MPLAQQLEELTAKLRSMVPAERLATIDRAVEELKASGLAERALKAGDRAPSFELPDGDGMMWRSEDLLRRGPLVIVFYRGRWCAYCNTQLAALQQIHSQLSAGGASLVAISPQTQKHSYMTRDMHKLRFPVLSDSENRVGGKFGLVYRISPEMQRLYEGIMTKLPGYNGDSSWELPMPATFAVRPDGSISFARVNADWRERPEPAEILHHFQI